jgi:thioredoxin reductase (NADPH)
MPDGGERIRFHRRQAIRNLSSGLGTERTATLDTDYDVVIAGGGIAGLTAGAVSARLGRKTLILIGDMLGGNLLSIERIEGYPGFPDGVAGYELCPAAQEQAAEAGAELSMTTLEGIEALPDGWRVAGAERSYDARAVILATGTALKALGVPGEARLVGKGVSHCASCDAPLLRGRPVAVVGGGDSALQEALTLAEAASKVVILHRGDALSAQATYRERVAAHPGIDVRLNAEVEEILGGDTVTGARVRDTASGATDDFEADGVFIYIGLRPNTAFLDGRLGLDPSGAIPTDGAMRTELPGVFAAGTVRAGAAGRAVASAGDGTAAAIAADAYLSDGAWRDATGGSDD